MSVTVDIYNNKDGMANTHTTFWLSGRQGNFGSLQWSPERRWRWSYQM